MYDRVLQLTQQMEMEMLKSMVSMFQQIQPIVHGSWIDVWQLREKEKGLLHRTWSGSSII